MLTLTQKVAIRRHLGVPFAGTAQAGRLYGWRFTWYNEDLEYRMNNLQPSEAQLLTGASLGAFKIQGRPTVGDVLTYHLSDGTNTLTATYTVQQSDFSAPANPVNPSESSPLYSIALNSAIAINAAMASAGYNGVGVMPADLYSPAYLAPYFAEVQIQSSSPTAFTLTGSSTGTTNLTVDAQGVASSVRASIKDAVTNTPSAVYGYIALCDALAMAPAGADLSLRYKQADVVAFRSDEVGARDQQYRYYCHKLEEVLGGREYVDKFGSRSSGGAVA